MNLEGFSNQNNSVVLLFQDSIPENTHREMPHDLTSLAPAAHLPESLFLTPGWANTTRGIHRQHKHVEELPPMARLGGLSFHLASAQSPERGGLLNIWYKSCYWHEAALPHETLSLLQKRSLKDATEIFSLLRNGSTGQGLFQSVLRK